MTSANQAADELTTLRELVSTLQSALEETRKENSLLRQKIDALCRRVFGSSSEKIDAAQLELLLQMVNSGAAVQGESAPAAEKSSEPLRPRKERAQRVPENLPVVEEVIEPAEVIQEPEQWRLIGQEVSEQLDYEPARFLRRRIVRKKYVHLSDPDRAPVLAALPEKLLERGVAGPGLLAHILISKYCDHLPLYRQEQIFAQRFKINLPRATLARWVELCADWLQPIYEQIRTGVMAGGYAQVDETPVAYLAPGNGQTKQGYLWTACRPGGDVFYRWETSRAADCLERLVPREFKGVLQSDGYSAYGAFIKTRGGIELAGCWAHVRRKSMRRWNNHRDPPAGSCATSNTFTASKALCAKAKLDRSYGKRFVPIRAAPSWSESKKPWSSSKPAGAISRKACLAKPSNTRLDSGPRSKCSCARDALK